MIIAWRHLASGQRLAIKVLHTAVTRREELFAELHREFQHLQLLSHPNIVRVYEFDRDGDDRVFHDGIAQRRAAQPRAA